MGSFHVPPPVWALAAGVVQQRIASSPPPGRAARWTAGAVAAGSLALAGVAAAHFRAWGTTVDPVHPERATSLVTNGPYALTRNPMYVAMAGVLVAQAVWRRSAVALGPVAGFVAVIDRLQVADEEAALRARFGDAYDDYCRRVPRWVGPRVRWHHEQAEGRDRRGGLLHPPLS